MPRAVVLLSGGLDSTVTAAQAREDGYEIDALTVRYGQRHERELQAARDVAEALDVDEHVELDVDLSAWGGSALTDEAHEVPTDRDEDEMTEEIPVTYVPARNLVFLSLATSFGETREAEAVYIGANAVDFSGYPDCRPAFLDAFERTAREGTKSGVEGDPITVEAPLVDLPKDDIVELGVDLAAPLELTWTCYQGGQQACGRCDACQLRLEGFRKAGVEDPVPYADEPA
jgi:7-cyano-7-deazaguanine synthase